jgi:hypothetical protein
MLHEKIPVLPVITGASNHHFLLLFFNEKLIIETFVQQTAVISYSSHEVEEERISLNRSRQSWFPVLTLKRVLNKCSNLFSFHETRLKDACARYAYRCGSIYLHNR